MANIWLTTSTSNRANASNDNGGGYNDANYVGTYAQTYGLNGGPVAGESSCAISEHTDSNIKLTVVTSGFSDVQAGLMAYCEFSATYSNGWYEVTEAIDANNIVIDLVYSTDAPTCDINVGGFFAAPNFADDTGLVSAGDEQWIETGTYTLSGNWTMTAGSAGLPVTYKTVDSDGDEVIPTRTLQGGRATGELITTGMAVINGGASYKITTAAHTHLIGLSITGSIGDNLVAPASYVTISRCRLANTKTANNFSYAIQLYDYCRVLDSDISVSSATVLHAIVVDEGCAISGCRVTSAGTSSSEDCIKIRNGSVINNIVIGDGCLGINSGLYLNQRIDHNTIYDCVSAIYLYTSYSQNNLTVTNNLAFDCTNFIQNETLADTISARNNCLVNVTNVTSGTYASTLIDDDSNTESSQTDAQTFVDSSTGDYRLKTGSDAIGAAMFNGDCGAITDVATGGGGILINGGLLV